ncbi:MAG: hypothetical protein IPK72_17845 [Candidatus Eisenbacteria bacterium]|nr:hypothetical protein [Candidatus Eisenbacteria bacterium]
MDQARLKVPTEVAQQLGYYVYLYVDPRTGKPFYVGKGKAGRVLAHLSDQVESRKTSTIREIRAAGLEPQLEVLAHALSDEETALRIEAAVIDLFGLGELTNAVRGWKSVQLGRVPLSELIAYYAPIPASIVHPVILIRINRLYRHGMSDHDLYEATRGVWKVGDRRLAAQYACAVFHAVVREVYTIESWHAAGTLPYTTRALADVSVPGRWEFVGTPAPADVRDLYVGRSVETYFRVGAQSPVTYVGC